MIAIAAAVCLGLTMTAKPVATSARTQEATGKVEISLKNFKFTPADITLTAGKTVTLIFINEGTGGHNFIAKEFFASAQMDTETRTKLGKKGVVELNKGARMEITLTPKVGSYKVKCGHFLHAGLGMTGSISVR
ncbi:cupredoxin domain-containing protein [Sphingorhabdus arenilitoris]|uniref:Cupredoxin domain-containing protein n=2 Tax=Sphingorhabdus arenilitoris TaxID=1490041 RepID=A0ABV8RDN4_9SPHN